MTKHVPSCSVEQVGKQRNGRPRYWCTVHHASATGRYGARLSVCEAAYLAHQPAEILELDPHDFPGGIALWGAVAPVYDTTGMPPESGIHVHARRQENHKEIDGTYDAVRVKVRLDLQEERQALINSEAAVNHYISRFLGREIRALPCPHCGELHLDKDYFAVKPHRRHLCHKCGRYFADDRRAVSNPIAAVRASLALATRETKRPERPLVLAQNEYPGGIQIWASNPAIVWTADRPEEEGLHVHALVGPGRYALDETYSSVVIDGIVLDESQIQYLMAQSALSYLENKIVSLSCPHCSASHFDKDDRAFFPHVEHDCEACGCRFPTPGRRRLVVSNPFLETRQRLCAIRAGNS